MKWDDIKTNKVKIKDLICMVIKIVQQDVLPSKLEYLGLKEETIGGIIPHCNLIDIDLDNSNSNLANRGLFECGMSLVKMAANGLKLEFSFECCPQLNGRNADDKGF